MSTLTIPTAEIFLPLIEPARYKGAHGGRGSGKSHFYADYSVEESLRFPGDYGEGLCLVCVREVQRDLKHSAKKLIEDKLKKYGLSSGQGFKIYKDVISTPGDGVILFQGMQDYNADSIKSLERFHRSWTEEAHNLSERSLELLRPTMRWEDIQRGGYAEMWFSWNPDNKRDSVDKMFRGGKPPTDSVCVKANYINNPWFPTILEQERIDCLNIEPEQYEHIWNGGYVGIRKGAYFARQLAIAKKEGRFCRVAADPYLPVVAYCDIGGTGKKSDAFAMWIVQFVAREIRVLNYYEAVGQEFKDHLGWLKDEEYGPEDASVCLPHDGATHDKVHRVSYETAFRDAGYRVKVVPNQGTGAATERIREVRKLFPKMWFDKRKCEVGTEALSNYHEKWDDIRNTGLGPNHNWASHGADAFGLMCIAYEPPRPYGSIIKPKVIRAMKGKSYRT